MDNQKPWLLSMSCMSGMIVTSKVLDTEPVELVTIGTSRRFVSPRKTVCGVLPSMIISKVSLPPLVGGLSSKLMLAPFICSIVLMATVSAVASYKLSSAVTLQKSNPFMNASENIVKRKMLPMTSNKVNAAHRAVLVFELKESLWGVCMINYVADLTLFLSQPSDIAKVIIAYLSMGT